MALFPRFKAGVAAKAANVATDEKSTPQSGSHNSNNRSFRSIGELDSPNERRQVSQQSQQSQGCSLAGEAPNQSSRRATAAGAWIEDHGAAPPLLSKHLPEDPANLIDAYHERFSICVETSEIAEAQAHWIAAEEVGTSLVELARRQLAYWHHRLTHLRLPQSHSLARHMPALAELCSQPWLEDAASFGWTDVALFGCHPFAPLVRNECWGLATRLVLSPYNSRSAQRQDRMTQLVSIDCNAAIIETPTGARFTVCRSRRGLDEAVPLWELAETRGDNHELSGVQISKRFR